jgi:hypothetical protein
VKGSNAAVIDNSNQNGVILLVLCAPNLHHRERLISHRDTAQIELGAKRIYYLFQNISISPRSLWRHIPWILKNKHNSVL